MKPTYWALFIYDKTIKEKRLVGVYTEGADANTDALAMSNETQQPTVELFDVYDKPQYTSTEPADEQDSSDFDTPIHVAGEVR